MALTYKTPSSRSSAYAQQTKPAEDYDIAWLCALPNIEAVAAEILLDEKHNEPKNLGPSRGGHVYTYGRMGNYNVVIASLREGQAGNMESARMIPLLKELFMNLDVFMFVGIGGGIPGEIMTSPNASDIHENSKNVHLGDVVIATPGHAHSGVISYTQVKELPGRSELTTIMDKTGGIMSWASSKFATNYTIDASILDQHWTKFEDLRSAKSHLFRKFMDPGLEDKLYKSSFRHVEGNEQNDVDPCGDCGIEELVKRPQRHSRKYPAVFQGLILSGNLVRTAEYRDDLHRKYPSARCVEMEAAGLDGYQCLIVRGISDYADTHKSDVWRGWAAARAGVVAKEILNTAKLPLSRNLVPQRGSQNYIEHKLVFNTGIIDTFRGYEGICHTLENHLVNIQDKCTQSRKVILRGRSGCGKSAICDYFYHKNCEQYWGAWRINGSTVGSLEVGFDGVAKALGYTLPTGTDQNGCQINRIIAYMNDIRKYWLLILDNANDEQIPYEDYMPSSAFGSILLASNNSSSCRGVSRSRDVEDINVKDLSEDDAADLLQAWIGNPRNNPSQKFSRTVIRLAVKRFSCHPIAIKLAAPAIIAQSQRGFMAYDDVLMEYITSIDRNQSGPEHSLQKLGSIYETSISEICMRESSAGRVQRAEDAVELLYFFSFLSSEDISSSIFERLLSNNQDSQRPDLSHMSPLFTKSTVQSPRSYEEYTLNILKGSGRKDDKLRRIETAVALLRDNFLVEEECDRRAPGWKISMHPLVQECGRASRFRDADADKMIALQAVITLSRSVMVHSGETAIRIKWFRRSVLPHFEALQKINCQGIHKLLESVGYQLAAEVQLCISIVYFESGKIKTALEIQTELLTRLNDLESSSSLTDPLIFKVMAFRATSLHDLNGPDQRHEALEYRRSIKTGWDAYLDEHRDVRKEPYLASLSDLADSYDQSRGYQHLALELRERVLNSLQSTSPHDYGTVDAKRRLARTCYILRKRNEALRYREEIFEELFKGAEKDMDCQIEPRELKLNVLSDLAESYNSKGFYTKAMSIRETVFQRRTELLGNMHVDTLAAESNLAESYMRVGRFEDAINCRKNIFETYETLFTFQHPVTLRSYRELGQAYNKIEDYNKAYNVHQEALNRGWEHIAVEERERYHADVIAAKAEMAASLERKVRVRKSMNDERTACNAFRCALQLRDQIFEVQTLKFGMHDELSLMAKNGKANCFSATGKFIDAYRLRTEVLAEHEKHVLRPQGLSSNDDHLEILRRIAVDCECYAASLKPDYIESIDEVSDNDGPIPSTQSAGSVESFDTQEGSHHGSEDEKERTNFLEEAMSSRRMIYKICLEQAGAIPDARCMRAVLDLAKCLGRDDINCREEAIQLYEYALRIMEHPDRFGKEHYEVLDLRHRLEAISHRRSIEDWSRGVVQYEDITLA